MMTISIYSVPLARRLALPERIMREPLAMKEGAGARIPDHMGKKWIPPE